MLNHKKLTAREIMNDDVFTLREDTPIREAIAALEDYRISGAPVVNALGECVGVFSTTDLVKRDSALEERDVPRAGDYFSSDPFSEDPDEYFAKDDYDEEILGRDTVGQWMTPEVQKVDPEASVAEVCSRMLKERIHRVLVMEGPRVRGIITTFDVVRLVAGDTAEGNAGHPARGGSTRGPKH